MNACRFLILACYLLLVSVAQADDAETIAAHQTIRNFAGALFKGDASAAQDLCTDGPQNKAVIQAMADEYKSQNGYCEMFKRITGFRPTTQISIRRAIDEKLDDYAVDFGDSVAHSFWGGYSLRKVTGKWKIVFAEYDFDRALTEQLELLRGRPELYKKGIDQLKSKNDTRWWVAESDFCSMQWDFEHQKYKSVMIEASKVVEDRARAGVQGTWQASIEPSFGEHPLWPRLKATLNINGDKLEIAAQLKAIKIRKAFRAMGAMCIRRPWALMWSKSGRCTIFGFSDNFAGVLSTVMITKSMFTRL